MPKSSPTEDVRLGNTVVALQLVNLKAQNASATALMGFIVDTAHVAFFSVTFSVVETLHMFNGGAESLKVIHWLRSVIIVWCIQAEFQYSAHLERKNDTEINSLTDCFLDLACIGFRSLFCIFQIREKFGCLFTNMVNTVLMQFEQNS